MRLFDPPIIPEFGLLPQGGLLSRADIPIIGQNLLMSKVENLISGDVVRLTTHQALERIRERRGLLKK